MKLSRLVSVMLLCSVSLALAEESPDRIVSVKNGMTRVDFTGDGVPDLVISGYRENYNAHSFDVVSFYVSTKAAGTKVWNIVPIIGKEEQWSVRVSGGADCLLHDFRLLSGSRTRPASLVIADRAPGDSYASEETVTFTRYTLNHRTDGTPGFPPYSFDLSKVSTSKLKYCDVGEAFAKELGLGQH